MPSSLNEKSSVPLGPTMRRCCLRKSLASPKKHLWKGTYSRLDVEAQALHKDIAIGSDDRYVLELNIFRFDDLATTPEN